MIIGLVEVLVSRLAFLDACQYVRLLHRTSVRITHSVNRQN